MFEKEAEEILNNHCDCELLPECMAGIRCRCSDFEESKKLLIEGIEFGNNKANEWHYPSKGEYPKEYEDIWICFLTEDDMKDCIRGWYEYDLDEDEHYFKTVNTFGTEIIKKPYAWKEYVLPEL